MKKAISIFILSLQLTATNTIFAKEKVSKNDQFKMAEADLSYYLDELAIKMGEAKLDTQTLYYSQSLIPIQKVKGGYIFMPNPALFKSSSFSAAFLQTDLELQSDPFCLWMRYESEFTYKTMTGFPKTIPLFKVHKGEKPNLKPFCLGTFH